MNGPGRLDSERSPSFIEREAVIARDERQRAREHARRQNAYANLAEENKELKQEVRELRANWARAEEQVEHQKSLVEQAQAGRRNEIGKGIKAMKTLKAREREIKSLKKEIRPLRTLSRVSIAWWIYRLSADCWGVWLYPLMMPLLSALSRRIDWICSMARTEMYRRADRHEGK